MRYDVSEPHRAQGAPARSVWKGWSSKSSGTTSVYGGSAYTRCSRPAPNRYSVGFWCSFATSWRGIGVGSMSTVPLTMHGYRYDSEILPYRTMSS